jgi:DNA invertase Pin-like site-specific DNA recombinase
MSEKQLLPLGSLNGTRHPKSKVTEEIVIYIRASNKSLSVLAKELGISKSHTSHIKNKKVWKHV